MGPVLSHTAALRGRKFGGNGRTRVTTLYYNPPHFILNPPPSDKSNLCFLFQRLGTPVVLLELGRWAGSAVTYHQGRSTAVQDMPSTLGQ